MGIKHFFIWFKKNFNNNITKLEINKKFSDINVDIDNLMIDMNGLFHNSTQKIFEYGNFKPNKRLLGKSNLQRLNFMEKQKNVFEDICKNIDHIFNIVNPKKRIILCVDGSAPLTKQNQQRQRRFRSAIESDKNCCIFDSNSLTPGTKFMDHLTKYIDWYIRKKISEDENWRNIEVIFSNEKVPGEGEHKLINYIRRYGDKNQSYCVHGLDADLIMLCLGTGFEKMYILRDELCDKSYQYNVIDIGLSRNDISKMLKWTDESKYVFSGINSIYDFIFMCFTVGNDFLPHIPGIEIILGGIDFMIDIYKTVGENYGHLTISNNNTIRFNKKNLAIFLSTISQYEKEIFEQKLQEGKKYIPDKILNNSSTHKGEKWEVNIESYRNEYYNNHFQEDDLERVCHEYLDGMKWVLSYYIYGVPDWKWRYNHHYAPFSVTLAKYLKTYKFSEYPKTCPISPFIQLLCVLPPKSSRLLPKPLDDILNNKLHKYCPEKVEIDYDGKRHEWEGIVKLPMIDYDTVKKEYDIYIENVNENEKKRNKIGKSLIYKKIKTGSIYKSFYGDFLSYTSVCFIDF
jgi:5'-3' exonuclease